MRCLRLHISIVFVTALLLLSVVAQEEQRPFHDDAITINDPEDVIPDSILNDLADPKDPPIWSLCLATPRNTS